MTHFYEIVVHLKTALFFGALPTIGIALFCAFLAVVTKNRRLIQFAFLFGLVGASMGLLLGASREPAVNAFLPAILTLLGGMIVYVFPKKEARISLLASGEKETPDPQFVRSFVMVAISALMISTVTGANFGASVRQASEEFDREYERWKLHYEKVEMPLELQQVQKALGLSSQSAASPAD